MLGGDADAGVFHVERRTLARLAPRKAHGSTFRGVADRVAHEVAEGAGDFLLGAEEHRGGFGDDFDAVAPTAQRPRIRSKALDERLHVDRLLHRRRRRRFERGECQQVLDEALHALRLVAHQVDVTPRGRRVGLLLAQRLEKPADHGKGRAHLVGDVGDELAAHALEALELRDVAREQQALAFTVGNYLEGQQAPLDVRRAKLDRARIVAAFEVRGELRNAHQVRNRRAGVARRVKLQVQARRVVAPRDALVLEDHHAVGKRARRLAPARERVGQGRLAARGLAPRTMHEREQLVPHAAEARRLRRLALLEPAAEQVEMPQVAREQCKQQEGEAGPTPLRLENDADGGGCDGERRDPEKAPGQARCDAGAGHEPALLSASAWSGTDSPPRGPSRRARRGRWARAPRAGAGCARRPCVPR